MALVLPPFCGTNHEAVTGLAACEVSDIAKSKLSLISLETMEDECAMSFEGH
jgi:hypothetical protein